MQMLTFEGVFGGPVGTCRYNPPTDDCTWPIVLETDWCGKFKLGSSMKCQPKRNECYFCFFFSDGKILGQHPTVPA